MIENYLKHYLKHHLKHYIELNKINAKKPLKDND
jgi:hypothetical protein